MYPGALACLDGSEEGITSDNDWKTALHPFWGFPVTSAELDCGSLGGSFNQWVGPGHVSGVGERTYYGTDKE